ncbi:MAG: hypothetical protein AB1416_04950 [Actinomycetota bacterium]
MPRLQRISITLPLADPGVDPESLVPVFHDWIRRDAVDGLLLDVARYAHVHHGPGVLLIGHHGDYSLDTARGRPGLRYTLKHDAPGTPRELVARSLQRLLGAAAEAAEAPGLTYDAGELIVQVLDRLRAPNTPDTLAALGPEIAAGVADVLGDAGDITVLDEDPRAPFAVRVAVPDPALIEERLAGVATA